MAKSARRYPLIVYTHMMDRWRPWVMWLGILLIGLAGILFYRGDEQWRWTSLISVGVFNIFFSVLMWLARNGAYVQLFPTYMRLATPFLRINISYKRFRRSGPANMGATFPPNRVSSAQAEVVQQLAGMTAVIIDLTGYPISQTAMRFFLSPLFFKDKTPHLVILVEDWMGFSSEMDSLRSGAGNSSQPLYDPQRPAQQPQPQQQKRGNSSILSKLPPKK